MDLIELKNLSLLLTSVDDSSIELGLEILKNNEKDVPVFNKELLLISQLHQSKHLTNIADNLLTDHIHQPILFEQRKGFYLFRSPPFSYSAAAQLTIDAHEAIRTDYQYLVERNSHYAEEYFRVGNRLAQTTEFYLVAEKYIQFALSINPTNEHMLHFFAGFLSRDLKRVEEGILYYLKIVENNPQNTSVWNRLGVLEEQLGNYEMAYEYYFKATQYPSINHTYYQKNLASLCVHFLTGKKYQDEAKKILEYFVTINNGDSFSWLSWGNYLWLVENDYEAVEKAYLEGLKLNPNSSDLLGNLAELYVDIFQRYDDGLIYYKKALENSCSNYQLLNIVTFYVLHQKKYLEGKKHFVKLLKLQPDILTKKISYLSDKQWDDFKKSVAILIEKYPKLKQ